MATIPIEADYLVIGAGATAMAFVDTLLSENTDATAVMVDRQHRPAGTGTTPTPLCACTSLRSITAWPRAN
jgi:hypothetical protein